jgi:hypothetical protein
MEKQSRRTKLLCEPVKMGGQPICYSAVSTHDFLQKGCPCQTPDSAESANPSLIGTRASLFPIKMNQTAVTLPLGVFIIAPVPPGLPGSFLNSTYLTGSGFGPQPLPPWQLWFLLRGANSLSSKAIPKNTPENQKSAQEIINNSLSITGILELFDVEETAWSLIDKDQTVSWSTVDSIDASMPPAAYGGFQVNRLEDADTYPAVIGEGLSGN